MQTFWIVIISVLVLVGLAMIAFLVWYFNSKKPWDPVDPPMDPIGPIGPPNSPILNYGDTLLLTNKLSNIALAVCGTGTRPTITDCTASYNVTLATSTSLASQKWKVLNQQNNNKSGPVRYGDQIILTSLYRAGPGLNLAACGVTYPLSGPVSVCGVNVVAGRTLKEPITETWTIVGGTVGANVMNKDTVQLSSGYAPTLFLSACGYYNAGGVCGVNVSLRTDDAAPQSKFWSINK